MPSKHTNKLVTFSLYAGILASLLSIAAALVQLNPPPAPAPAPVTVTVSVTVLNYYR